MHIDAAAVCVSLPSFSGLVTVIELPKMNEEELEGAIRFEAPKYIPLPLEEVVLSWEILQPDPGSPGKMRILLVAALDKDIARYESYLHGQSLSLEFLELEIFSLVRSTISDKTKNWLIVDIGSRAANIILVEQGLVTANRTIDRGGNEITNTLMDGMQVNWARAEQLKKGAVDYFQQPGSKMVFPTVEMVNYEAKRMLESAKKQNRTISGVILSGGSVKMKGLDQYISNALQLPVTFANPWSGVRFPEPLRPIIDRYGSSFSIALGLALGGLNEK
jgi:type IV pilus assembly protein PilM